MEWEAIAIVAGIACNTVVLVVLFAAGISANTLLTSFIINILQHVGPLLPGYKGLFFGDSVREAKP